MRKGRILIQRQPHPTQSIELTNANAKQEWEGVGCNTEDESKWLTHKEAEAMSGDWQLLQAGEMIFIQLPEPQAMMSSKSL